MDVLKSKEEPPCLIVPPSRRKIALTVVVSSVLFLEIWGSLLYFWTYKVFSVEKFLMGMPICKLPLIIIVTS